MAETQPTTPMPRSRALGIPLPQTLKARIAALIGAAVVLLFVLSQLLLPGLGEDAIHDRLTADGGVAEVQIGAFPAARLLWGSGDSLKITGNGLDLAEATQEDPVILDDLDRFDDVEIVLQDTTAGPFEINNFVLARHGDAPYTLKATTTTSASQLAAYGIDRAELPGAGIVGSILDLTGLGGRDVPIDLDLSMNSDSGRISVVDGGGTVAGLPTGPLAELITSAIAIRI